MVGLHLFQEFNMRISTFILPLAMIAVATPALAQRMGPWQTIGTRKVAFAGETDKFAVRGNQRHRQVRICALNRQFKLLDADVFFANGGEQDVLGGKRTIRAGMCTRPMDLRGNRRDIRSVKLAYSRFSTGAAPRVSVQAR
jgi:hypothetical protein